jgi:hypothetical protein
VEPWCDARFDVFAPDFDGLTWFVARKGTVYAVDADAGRWEHLWKVDEERAQVREIRRDASSLSVWFDMHGSRREIWIYDLPSLYLRRREQIEICEGAAGGGSIGPDGQFAEWRSAPDGATAWLRVPVGWQELPVKVPEGAAAVLAVTKGWAVLSEDARHAAVIHVLDCSARKVRARVTLEPGGSGAGARIQGERLLLFDSCGRVLILSLKNGTVLCEHRRP